MIIEIPSYTAYLVCIVCAVVMTVLIFMGNVKRRKERVSARVNEILDEILDNVVTPACERCGEYDIPKEALQVPYTMSCTIEEELTPVQNPPLKTWGRRLDKIDRSDVTKSESHGACLGEAGGKGVRWPGEGDISIIGADAQWVDRRMLAHKRYM